MIRTLQAGRAIAAISVAAFHLSLMMGQARYGGEEVFRQFTKEGHKGVDFFFVLSGFIILFAHFNDVGEPKAFSRYAYRRFARLFPIYWLYTLVFVVLLAIIGGTDAQMPSTVSGWITSATLIRFSDVAPPLPVAWTLFHEVAFYAAFSVLILSKRLGLAIFLVIGAITVLLYHFPAETERTPFNVYSSAYNLYFALGMGAYWLYRSGGTGIPELILGSAVATLSLGGVLVPHEILPIALAFSMALFLAGATKLETSGKISVPIWLGFVGDASYSIYLTHSNFEGTLLKIAKYTGLRNLIGNEITYLMVLSGAIVLGCAAYYLIEKPLLRILGRRKKIRAENQ